MKNGAAKGRSRDKKKPRESGHDRDLLESIPAAILVHKDGKLLYANRAALDLYGARTAEELTPKHLAALGLDGRQEAKGAGETNKPDSDPLVKRLDGRKTPVETMSSSIGFEGTAATQTLLRDISARRRSEQRVRLLARLVLEEPNPIFRLSRSGRVLYANKACDLLPDQWGVSAGHAVSGPLRRYLLKTSAKREVVDIEAKDKSWRLSFSRSRLDGSINVYAIDVSDLATATEALRASEERLSHARDLLEAVTEGTGVIIATQDKGLRYTYFNSAYKAELKRLTGKDIEIGMSMAEALADQPEQRDVAIREWKRVLAGETENDRFEFGGMGGHGRVYNRLRTPLRDERGSIIGAGEVAYDVTPLVEAEEALRESEERQRLAKDGAGAGVWEWNPKTGEAKLDARTHAMYGLPDGSIRRQEEWAARVHPEDIGRVNAEREAAIARHEPFELEFRTVSDSGEVRWINARGLGRYNDGGEIERVLGVNVDITSYKRAEEALQEREEEARRRAEELEKLMDAVPTAVWVSLDPDCSVIVGNRAANDFYEAGEGDNVSANVGGPGAIRRFFSEGRELSAEELPMQKAAATGRPILASELQVLMPSGKFLSMYGNAIPLFNDDGSVRGAIAVFVDLTERRQMEEALRESEARLESLAENVPSVLMRFGRDLRLVYLSRKAEAITGVAAEECAVKTSREIGMPEELCDLWDKAVTRVFETGKEESVEFEFPLAEGPRSSLLKLAPERNEKGEVEYVLGVSTEVTDLKQAQEQLERLRSEFYGVISHELKTPLTAIKGSAAIALTSRTFPEETEARELFEVISEQSDRLTEMVNNLLDMTRIEAGTFSVEPRDVRLSEIVADAVNTFRRAGYEHEVRVKLPKQLPAVRADRRRIVQVAMNLLTNAAKASPPGLPIDLVARKDGERAVIGVSDQGAGMSADTKLFLFRKFSRPGKGKGTGLGLWIADSIVKAHGGRIWAESEGPGMGSTFRFTLPLAGSLKQADEPAAPNLRVLAVDDEPSILRFVERFLTVAGHQVITTPDPFEVPGLVKSEKPDVLVLDMKMPGKSGVEILEEIRQFSQVPVVVITATDNEQEIAKARRHSGVSWLPKPFAPDELLEHVKQAALPRRAEETSRPALVEE
jgi:PAS domain S-box-containing protein